MCHHRDFDREWVFDRDEEEEEDEKLEAEDGPLATDERDVDVELLTDGGDE